MTPGPSDAVYRVRTSLSTPSDSGFGTGSRVMAMSADGTIAYVDLEGALWLADQHGAVPSAPALEAAEVRSAAFGPGGGQLVIEVAAQEGSRLELFDPASGSAHSARSRMAFSRIGSPEAGPATVLEFARHRWRSM